ncbi:MAG TPA: hypothetical protein VGC45_11260 [Gryllotalpicola sp.]
MSIGVSRPETVSRPLVVSRLRVAVAVVGVLLNLAVVAFYVLYRIADEWAVDRSEAFGGFDQSYLLPHDALTWLVGTAAVVLLLVTDVLGGLLLLATRDLLTPRDRSSSPR